MLPVSDGSHSSVLSESLRSESDEPIYAMIADLANKFHNIELEKFQLRCLLKIIDISHINLGKCPIYDVKDIRELSIVIDQLNDSYKTHSERVAGLENDYNNELQKMYDLQDELFDQ